MTNALPGRYDPDRAARSPTGTKRVVSMPIQFCCTQCGQPIEVDDEHAGQTAACPYCRHMVGVPAQSTYNPAAAASARPATSAGTIPPQPGVPPVPYAAPDEQRPLQPTVRRRAATTLGNYALICTLLAMILYGAGIIGGISLTFGELAKHPGATLDRAQIEASQQLMTQQPWIIATQFGGLFFALVGLVLGIVSLVQARAGNWQGMLAVAVCGLFMLCICTVAIIAVATGLGGVAAT